MNKSMTTNTLVARLEMAAKRMEGADDGELMEEAAKALRILITAMADFSLSDDITLDVMRAKAGRLYGDYIDIAV